MWFVYPGVISNFSLVILVVSFIYKALWLQYRTIAPFPVMCWNEGVNQLAAFQMNRLTQLISWCLWDTPGNTCKHLGKTLPSFFGTIVRIMGKLKWKTWAQKSVVHVCWYDSTPCCLIEKEQYLYDSEHLYIESRIQGFGLWIDYTSCYLL